MFTANKEGKARTGELPFYTTIMNKPIVDYQRQSKLMKY